MHDPASGRMRPLEQHLITDKFSRRCASQFVTDH
jgi:hypothetical protein